jgi:transcription initiation factor TFIIIB Brf1 subunit/transcription initiation factor TFIIB
VKLGDLINLIDQIADEYPHARIIVGRQSRNNGGSSKTIPKETKDKAAEILKMLTDKNTGIVITEGIHPVAVVAGAIHIAGTTTTTTTTTRTTGSSNNNFITPPPPIPPTPLLDLAAVVGLAPATIRKAERYIRDRLMLL